MLLSIGEDGDEVGDADEPSNGVLALDESSLTESTSVDSDSSSLSNSEVFFFLF